MKVAHDMYFNSDMDFTVTYKFKDYNAAIFQKSRKINPTALQQFNILIN